jgi:hypothetical protein
MSESSEHILNNDLDITGEHTDDESLMNDKKVRSKNREYEPVCSFKSIEAAKNLLKSGFFDSQWTQLNTKKNIIWFKCKTCDKRLKLVCFDYYCVVHIEDTYFTNGVHLDEEKEMLERGIPKHLRAKIVQLDNAGVRGIEVPLERKRNRGAKSTTKPALIRQSIDQQNLTNAVAIQLESDDDEREPDPKRANPEVVQPDHAIALNQYICGTCGSKLLKRRYTFCPNKCKK